MLKIFIGLGPCLMGMWVDWKSRSREFEFRHRILLDAIILLLKLYHFWRVQNINKKEAKLKKVLSKLLVVQFSEFCHNSCPKTYRETVKGVKDGKDGWEPWSSVYGSRLTIQRLWVRISAPNTTWIFSHLFALILFEKTENKMKKRPGNRYIRRMSTY